MKIVFLTPQLPFPPQSGGVIKSHRLVQYLSQKHEVHLACFLKNQDEQYLERFSESLVLKTFVYEPLNIKRSLFNFILSLWEGIPLTVLRNKSRSFAQMIFPLLAEADVIFVDHYIMFQYVPSEFRGKIILHQHNAEYVLWLRYAQQCPNPLKKILLTFESLRIKKFEKEIGERASYVMASPNDKDELMKLGLPDEKFVLTWHLGDEQLLKQSLLEFSQTKKVLLNVGTLSWEPNLDGLKWFIAESWPKLKMSHPDLELWIAGKGADDVLKILAASDPQIKLLGFVDDLENLYRTSRVFIAPLRFGSGIKVKVINALYRGLAVVTTPIGVEGMEVISGQHLLVSTDASDFAKNVNSLLQDENLWNKISKEGRNLVQEKYTWGKVFNEMEKIL